MRRRWTIRLQRGEAGAETAFLAAPITFIAPRPPGDDGVYLNLSPEHVIKEFMEKW